MLSAVCALPQARQSSAVPAPAAVPDNETPAQFYARYLDAVKSASTIEEVLAFWREDLVKQFNAAPPDQRVDLSAMKRFYAMTGNVKVTDVVTADTGATLTLEGTRDGARAGTDFRPVYAGSIASAGRGRLSPRGALAGRGTASTFQPMRRVSIACRGSACITSMIGEK
jgi:hypothetical protein